MLALGVGCVMLAVVLDALAYKRLTAAGRKTPTKGIVLSVVAGVLMGFFYSFVAQAMGRFDSATLSLEAGKLSPYTAIVLFSAGVLASNFLWKQHRHGETFQRRACDLPRDYFEKGNARLHLIGILGGMIWNVGMSFSIIASAAAGRLCLTVLVRERRWSAPSGAYSFGRSSTGHRGDGAAARGDVHALRDRTGVLIASKSSQGVRATSIVVVGSSNTDMIIACPAFRVRARPFSAANSSPQRAARARIKRWAPRAQAAK